MPNNPWRDRFYQQFSRFPAQPPSLLQKILALLVTAGVFTLALMLSVVLFAAVLTAGAVAGGYLWWKTRTLRKRMRERPPSGGLVIEGEVIREVGRREAAEGAERRTGGGPRT